MNALHKLLKAAVVTMVLGAAAPAMATHYVYYGSDVYYAPEARVYYWRDHGNWHSGATIAHRHRGLVRGNGFEIELNTSRPYDRHDYVLARYRDWRRDHHDSHHYDSHHDSHHDDSHHDDR